jgi:hypothetical protein
MPVALLLKAGSLECLKFSCPGEPMIPHHHPCEGSLQTESLFRPWEQLSKGSRSNAFLMLWCSGVYVGKGYGRRKTRFIIEISGIELVEETGRGF